MKDPETYLHVMFRGTKSRAGTTTPAVIFGWVTTHHTFREYNDAETVKRMPRSTKRHLGGR